MSNAPLSDGLHVTNVRKLKQTSSAFSQSNCHDKNKTKQKTTKLLQKKNPTKTVGKYSLHTSNSVREKSCRGEVHLYIYICACVLYVSIYVYM